MEMKPLAKDLPFALMFTDMLTKNHGTQLINNLLNWEHLRFGTTILGESNGQLNPFMLPE
jgi:hypothetical protein